MASAAGRQRYRWLLLLLVAGLLLAWMLVDGTQRGDSDVDGSAAPSGTSSPTHELTETNTPTSDPTSDGPDDTGGDGATDPESGLPIVQVSALPPEAARTLELIDRGGPFPEPEHDGGTFENREALLPEQPMGYYKEYTVPTPGSDDRGARRIVAGEGGELYYTGDHYSSFSRIAR
jgi:ribonuclease T1